ncbi:RcpC/CpaB family pilus assembly protein [Nocardiopsis sediminis]|uniref:RcpC/CpaB family pilus assembly protein n=1 Tax=Nocardiopsis sediminis TaxID=1778267 RepID=A0ABV8FIZ4_9ACTN
MPFSRPRVLPTDRGTAPHRAARVLARYRRTAGAVCAVLAAVGAVLLIRPPPAATTDVLVAARDLNGVAPIASGDLVARSLPAAAVPDRAVPAGSDPSGRSLAGPMSRGEVLTRTRLADPPAAAHGPGMVAAPVRVADPGVVALLHPGSRVDILAAASDPLSADLGGGPARPAETVAADRPVIAVPGRGGSGTGPGGSGVEAGGSGADTGGLLVVAVTPREARDLAGYAVAGSLSITIRG